MDEKDLVPYDLVMPITQAIQNDNVSMLMELTLSMESLNRKIYLDKNYQLPVCLRKGPYLVHVAAYYGSVTCFRTIIHFAAYSASSEIFYLLNELNIKTNRVSRRDVRPIHIAAKYGNYDMCCWLWINGQSIWESTSKGNTPLQLAMYGKHYNVAAFLLKVGADPIDNIDKNSTVLNYAIVNRIKEILDIIIVQLNQHKYWLSIKDDIARYLPIHYAAKIGELEYCKIFFIAENEETSNNPSKMSPLHLAVESGNLDTVKFFVENGYDIHIKNQNGDTLLHLAAKGNSFDIIQYLSERGLEQIKNNNYVTPLLIATNKGSINIIRYLLEYGGNPNEGIFEKGLKALHIAVKKKSYEIVELLLDWGAKTDDTDDIGRIPMHYAALNGNIPIIQLLWDAGSEINVGDNNDDYPLNLAVLKNNEKCIDYLTELDACSKFGYDEYEVIKADEARRTGKRKPQYFNS